MAYKKLIPAGNFQPTVVDHKPYKKKDVEPGSQEETDEMQKKKGNELMREKKGLPMTGDEGVQKNKSTLADEQRKEAERKYKGKKKYIKY